MRKPLPVNSRDVARRAGVSQATVSKVANDNPVITAETRARVICAARELGYDLNSGKKRRRVAVIVPEQRFFGYVAAMLSGVSQEILGRGMGMEILPDSCISLLNERCIDGAIALSWKNDFCLKWSETMPLPLVRINGPSDHANNCYSVCPDGMSSMRSLLERLRGMGHGKIAFFFFNTYEHEIHNVAGRLEGFLAAMRAGGVNNPEQYCVFDCLRKSGRELSRQLAAWHDEGVTAIIFANQLGTGKMMQCLQFSGLKVPRDISVVGWEQPHFSEYTVPALSTLSPDPGEFARAAVALLVRMISRDFRNLHDILLPYHWIERESLGPAPNSTHMGVGTASR